MAVAFSDGGGLIETLRESVALVIAQACGLQRYPDNELIRALLTDRSDDQGRRPLGPPRAQAPADARRKCERPSTTAGRRSRF